MKTDFPASIKRRQALTAVAALSLSGCALPKYVKGPVAEAAAPNVKAGDRWDYEVVNLYNGLSLGRRTATVAPRSAPGELMVALSDGPTGFSAPEAYADAWRIIEEPFYDRLQGFKDPVPILPSRLRPSGTEFMETTYQVPAASGQFKWRQWMNVPGWEQVAVPAGNFLCLRVERHILFEHSDVFRLNSQRYDTAWYAPEVQRWVKREWTGYYIYPGGRSARSQEAWERWELLKYQPA